MTEKDQQKQSETLRVAMAIKNKLLEKGLVQENGFDTNLHKAVSALLDVRESERVIDFLLKKNPYFDGLSPIDLVGSEWALNNHLLPYIKKMTKV